MCISSFKFRKKKNQVTRQRKKGKIFTALRLYNAFGIKIEKELKVEERKEWVTGWKEL